MKKGNILSRLIDRQSYMYTACFDSKIHLTKKQHDRQLLYYIKFKNKADR